MLTLSTAELSNTEVNIYESYPCEPKAWAALNVYFEAYFLLWAL